MPDHKKYFKQIMFLDNFTCVYCGKRSPNMTIDHYIPQSLGGPDVIQNLVACCGSCNSSKHDKAPYEWGRIPQFGRFAKFYQGIPVMVIPPEPPSFLDIFVLGWRLLVVLVFGVAAVAVFLTYYFGALFVLGGLAIGLALFCAFGAVSTARWYTKQLQWLQEHRKPARQN